MMKKLIAAALIMAGVTAAHARNDNWGYDSIREMQRNDLIEDIRDIRDAQNAQRQYYERQEKREAEREEMRALREMNGPRPYDSFGREINGGIKW